MLRDLVATGYDASIENAEPDRVRWPSGGVPTSAIKVTLFDSSGASYSFTFTADRNSDVTGAMANEVQDIVSECLSPGTPWPPCPFQRTHPLRLRTSETVWRWHCPTHGFVAPIGSLGSATSGGSL